MVTLVDKLRLRPAAVPRGTGTIENKPYVRDKPVALSLVPVEPPPPVSQLSVEPLVVDPVVTNLIPGHVVENDLSLVAATGYTTLRPLADYLAMLGPVASSTAVTMVQMRKALVSTGGGAIYTVQNNISADIADPVNIAWSVGTVVAPGDVLAVSIQASLGYSAAQMDALFALARTM